MVIDFEQYKPGEDKAVKDEGELTAAKRLVKRVSENYRELIDIIVYDAIACSFLTYPNNNKKTLNLIPL